MSNYWKLTPSEIAILEQEEIRVKKENTFYVSKNERALFILDTYYLFIQEQGTSAVYPATLSKPTKDKLLMEIMKRVNTGAYFSLDSGRFRLYAAIVEKFHTLAGTAGKIQEALQERERKTKQSLLLIAQPPKEQDNTLLYVGGFLGVLAIVAGIFYANKD